MKSYKTTSRIITIISAIITFLSTLTAEQLSIITPHSLESYIPYIIILITFLANQLSEEKRVTTAEDLVKEQIYTQEIDNGVWVNREYEYDEGV